MPSGRNGRLERTYKLLNASGSPWRRPDLRRLGWPSRLALLVTFTLPACGTPGAGSYRMTIPILEATPVEGPCRLDDGSQRVCLRVLREDWIALIVELKAACLALGGNERECQAGP